MAEESFSSNQNTAGITDFELTEPPECRVIIFNDDYTAKDFVVDVLTQIFHKPEEEAVLIMESVHNTGKGIAGVYTYDIAMTRVNMATVRARKNGFPLRLEVERV